MNFESNQQERIVQRLLRDERILAAYLVGSAVGGSLRFDSDVDVGLLPLTGRGFSALNLHDLAGELAILIERPVDLGVISGGNLIYAKECVFTGRRILCRDEYQADIRIAALMGMAMQFDFERREVVRAYSA